MTQAEIRDFIARIEWVSPQIAAFYDEDEELPWRIREDYNCSTEQSFETPEEAEKAAVELAAQLRD